MEVSYARALLTMALGASIAVPAVAQDTVTQTWDDFAFVSSTLGAYQGRLCVGADRGDVGCPTHAPSLTTAGDVSVTGNLSASKFIGDGSGLTGLSTASDRITSGTSSIIVSQSGHISFTTAGTERMVINSAGNVGIGTTAPTAALQINHPSSTDALEIRRTSHLGSQIFTIGRLGDITGGAAAFTQKLGHALPALAATSAMSNWPAARFKGASGQTANIFEVHDSANRGLLVVDPTGNVGIGTVTPTSVLQVSGTFTVSSTVTNANPALYVSTTGRVGIGTSTPARLLDVALTSSVANQIAAQISLAGNPLISLGERENSNYGGMIKAHDGAGGSDFFMMEYNAGYPQLRTSRNNISLAFNGGSLRANATYFDYYIGGVTRFYVASTGNVGIGTTSPNKTLSVSGTAEIVSRTLVGGTGTPSATLQVSGSLLLAGSDSTTCNGAYVGILRREPVTGRIQICR